MESLSRSISSYQEGEGEIFWRLVVHDDPSIQELLATALVETDLSKDPYINSHNHPTTKIHDDLVESSNERHDDYGDDDGLSLEMENLHFLEMELADVCAGFSPYEASYSVATEAVMPLLYYHHRFNEKRECSPRRWGGMKDEPWWAPTKSPTTRRMSGSFEESPAAPSNRIPISISRYSSSPRSQASSGVAPFVHGFLSDTTFDAPSPCSMTSSSSIWSLARSLIATRADPGQYLASTSRQQDAPFKYSGHDPLPYQHSQEAKRLPLSQDMVEGLSLSHSRMLYRSSLRDNDFPSLLSEYSWSSDEDDDESSTQGSVFDVESWYSSGSYEDEESTIPELSSTCGEDDGEDSLFEGQIMIGFSNQGILLENPDKLVSFDDEDEDWSLGKGSGRSFLYSSSSSGGSESGVVSLPSFLDDPILNFQQDQEQEQRTRIDEENEIMNCSSIILSISIIQEEVDQIETVANTDLVGYNEGHSIMHQKDSDHHEIQEISLPNLLYGRLFPTVSKDEQQQERSMEERAGLEMTDEKEENPWDLFLDQVMLPFFLYPWSDSKT